jgi:hypothetical protein
MEDGQKFSNRIYQFNFVNLHQVMSLEENNIKELCVYDPIKLGQLVRNILQKVDELFPPSSDSSLDNSVAQLYTLKNEIKKIDPSWKFENTNTLMYLKY